MTQAHTPPSLPRSNVMRCFNVASLRRRPGRLQHHTEKRCGRRERTGNASRRVTSFGAFSCAHALASFASCELLFRVATLANRASERGNPEGANKTAEPKENTQESRISSLAHTNTTSFARILFLAKDENFLLSVPLKTHL